jgi:hypothetical protein
LGRAARRIGYGCDGSPEGTRGLSLEASARVRKEEDCGEDLQPGHKDAPSSLLARAKKAAYENGATLLGDERSGRFSHDMAKGEYRMVGQTVIVTIAEKHWLLPWPVVEAQLRELVR